MMERECSREGSHGDGTVSRDLVAGTARAGDELAGGVFAVAVGGGGIFGVDLEVGQLLGGDAAFWEEIS